MSTAAPKKKRVLFIINQFFRGGAETALVNLLRTMDSARFDVDLLIFDMIDLPGSLSLIPEIPDWVHVINVAENEKKTAFVKKAVFKLERKLTGTQPFRRGAIRYLQNQYYDAAISYGEWFSSALCARYAAARRKYVWIHADMDKAAFLHPDILRFEAQFDGFLFASRHSMEGAVKKYPQLDIRVVEMKTNDIKKALQTGDIDAGIVAGLAGMEEFRQIPLFYEQFYTYIARENRLFSNEVIRTSDLTGEQLWLLDEGHCFRDQLERFCQLKAARASQLAYHLGSMETFMRMVESGKGITFIPELAVLQLNGTQKELVHPFAIPCPTRQIIMLTNRSFIRNTLLNTIVQEVTAAVPKEMLSLKATQVLV